jgi:hypothetical protein
VLTRRDWPALTGGLAAALTVLPIRFRMLKTWETIQPHVARERAWRGDLHSFMNSYEAFVERTAAEPARRRIVAYGERLFPKRRMGR